MKRIGILFIFLPLFCSAQSVDVSVLAGYSAPLSVTSAPYKIGGGFSSQLSASYFITPKFSAGVFYQTNMWDPGSHSFGVVPEYHARHYYLGADLGFLYPGSKYVMKTDNVGVTGSTYYDYSRSMTYGVHAGTKVRIGGHFYAKGQIGLNVSRLNGMQVSPLFFNNGGSQFPDGPFSQTVLYPTVMVGLAHIR